MGCVCGKPSAIEDSRESPGLRRPPPPAAAAAATAAVAPAKFSVGRVGVAVSASAVRREEGRAEGGGALVAAAERKQGSGPIRANGHDLERRRERERERAASYSQPLRVSGSVPKALEGEQVAAGWPPWLASAAGEAIRGWVPRRADSFEKLDKIGQGTYSNVYRARDLDKEKIVALKKVRFDTLEPESVKFMAREILILRRLDHPNIIKLEGLVTSRMSCSLYLVFEYMEHDLAGLASFPGLKFTEPQVKCYMQQLLRGLDHCHSRGILHRDIKGSNLLIDNSGILKIADFGLASFFDPDQRHPLTSRVVTLWYRPPELLLGATYYGVAVDLWSSGCILAELYAGKPIMPGRTEVEQLHKIFKLCGSPSEEYWRKSKLPHATIFKPQHPYRRCVAETFKDFPPAALALIDVLLSIDPADRTTAASALKSEFFTTKPLPCDPSSLPNYPPSKEFDAKRRDEEARRQGATGNKAQRVDPEKRFRECRAIPAPDANAELSSSLQKRQIHSNSMSRSEKFNPHQEEAASGFPIEPPRPTPVLEAAEDSQKLFPNRASHSGPLVHRTQWLKTQQREDDAAKASEVTNVLVRRKVLSEDSKEKISAQVEAVAYAARLSEAGNEHLEPTRKYSQVLQRKESERSGNMDPTAQQGFGPKGNKIHYSGPLIRPSGNVDQMLKDHDRQIQEVFRRARHDKSKVRKVGEGNQFGINPSDFGVGPVYPSSRAPSYPVFTLGHGGPPQNLQRGQHERSN
ncbi:putative serine/threonine-protein kinase [Ananas comosus]|uniref:[RNA-polymerase]-subunit kinase n=1 Tax=Ananas comosus TaxID=4615 RepID=A0A199USQ8_ANACO|nr:putative serine/threonine-protein kinase [Ananas comosus]